MLDTATLIQAAALATYGVAATMGLRVVWKRRRNPPLRDAYLTATAATLLMVGWRGWTTTARILEIRIPQPFGLNAGILVQTGIGVALALALVVALYPAATAADAGEDDDT